MGVNTRSCLAFLAVLLVACGLAWLGGYDFDRRGGDVAVGAYMALALAAGAALIVRRGVSQ